MSLVLDTGVLLAGMDADDDHHGPCRALIRDARELRVIPAPVLPEVDHFMRLRLGHVAFRDLLTEIRRGTYSVEDTTSADYDRVDELVAIYADLGVGFVDAAVLAVVERLGETKLATLDHRHFRVMRPRHRASIDLLPLV